MLKRKSKRVKHKVKYIMDRWGLSKNIKLFYIRQKPKNDLELEKAEGK
jgi:hypothetical protein